MILKRLTSVLTIKRSTSTDRQPTGFLQQNAVVNNMIQPKAVTPDKMADVYDVYDAVVGSSAQVTAGLANYSSIQAAVTGAPAGGSVLILQGTYTENVTVNQQLFIKGKGLGSLINGTLNFNSGGSFSIMKYFQVSGNVTLNAGANGIYLREFYAGASSVVTDNGTGNSVGYIQEP